MTTLAHPIIFDMGSFSSKIGMAGDTAPKTSFPSVVGYSASKSVLNQDSKDLYVGEQAQQFRDRLNLKYPIEQGVVTNWDDMERIYQYSFSDLAVNPHDFPIIVTEPPLNPKDHREKLVQLMFETHASPAVYLGNQASLGMQHFGHQKMGIAIDIGDTATYIVPMYQGHAIGHGVEKLNISGREITNYLNQLLTHKGFSFSTPTQRELVRDIKEKFAYVSQDFSAESRKVEEKTFELPDGQVVNLGIEMSQCAEILFQGSLIGLRTNLPYTVAKVLMETCRGMGSRIRKDWCSSIVLLGGASQLPGLGERLRKEVSTLLEPREEMDSTATATAKALSSAVKVYSLPQRNMASFLGASEFGASSHFGEAAIWRAEYYEVGASIVNRVCY